MVVTLVVRFRDLGGKGERGKGKGEKGKKKPLTLTL